MKFKSYPYPFSYFRHFLLIFIMTGLFLSLSFQSGAVIRTDQIIRKNAFFVKDENELDELYQSLDLVKRKYVFTPSDVKVCRKGLMRIDDSLSYTCTVGLPGFLSSTRLHEQISSQIINIKNSQQIREVEAEVSEDARFVTFSVQFDDSGIDFDLADFNDHFFNVYDQVALTAIAEAMKREPLLIEVLENDPKPQSPPSVVYRKIKKNKKVRSPISVKKKKQ